MHLSEMAAILSRGDESMLAGWKDATPFYIDGTSPPPDS